MRFGLGVTALVWLVAQPAAAESKVRRGVAAKVERAALRSGAAVASRSPCGRHFFELADGVVLVDGWPVHHDANVQLVGAPAWRSDGEAVAWIERIAGRIRLVVVPALRRAPAEPMTWALPLAMAREAIHWSTTSRVAIGPSVLAPRAVASWMEELESKALVDTPKE